MELVNKLKAAGLLGDGLLHTVNGREYVTRKYLKKEITSAVDSAGGRIALVTVALVLWNLIPAAIPSNSSVLAEIRAVDTYMLHQSSTEVA